MASPRHMPDIAGAPNRADRPASVAESWPAGQHVGGTTTQPRSVCTRSPTKWFGKSSRRGSATALLDPRPPTEVRSRLGLMQCVRAHKSLRPVD